MPPTEEDITNFASAIENKNEEAVLEFLKRDDANELLKNNGPYGYSPLNSAIFSAYSASFLKVLLDAGVKHAVIKDMLVGLTDNKESAFSVAAEKNLPFDSFKLLVEYATQHLSSEEIKPLLEEPDRGSKNCISIACEKRLDTESFKLLLDFCFANGVDMSKVILQQDMYYNNCVSHAFRNRIELESFKLLLDAIGKSGIQDLSTVFGAPTVATLLSSSFPLESIEFLFEFFAKQQLDVKKLIEEGDNFLLAAAMADSPPECIKFFIDLSTKHGVDIKKLIEQGTSNIDNANVFQLATRFRLSADRLQILLETSLQLGVDFKPLFENKSNSRLNVLMYAGAFGFSVESWKLLIAFFPSNSLFQKVLKEDVQSSGKTIVQLVEDYEVKQLLQDPECWKNAREWATTSCGVTAFPEGVEEAEEAPANQDEKKEE